ncbi:hypothetical protein [Desulfurobacterium sp.]|uniref:hypothetical protein n=1 Tax=Desulfurobacterium sp. TaxID=2004706 RepID=UPI0026284376|nr:hypothetical protein [Desulfurobacterium sp.]
MKLTWCGRFDIKMSIREGKILPCVYQKTFKGGLVMLKRCLVVLLLLMFLGVPAMADQIDGLASVNQPSPPSGLSNGTSPGLFVNPGGMGDVLIFPYYNVRNAVDFFKIVNTSGKGIVGKLRLREGKESKEVLDFLVCLSPHDEFTFWVANPAMLGISGDTAVVLRANAILPADDDTIVVPGGWNVAHTRTVAGVTADRTLEGYIEFFAIGSVTGTYFKSNVEGADDPVQACMDLLGYDGLEDAPNSLIGEGYIYNFTNLLDQDGISTYAYKAVALANFATDASMAANAGLGEDYPLFGSTSALAGLDAVNYVLTKTHIYVLYDLQNWLMGQTDVILNFVTKKESVEAGKDLYVNKGNCGPGNYTDCCVPLKVQIYDDEENTPKEEVDFSPREEGGGALLCNEVSYIPVGATASPILETKLKEVNVDTTYELGWLDFYFSNSTADCMFATTVNSTDACGEPVIGLQLMDYFGGIIDHMLPVNYGVKIVLPLD